MKRLFTLCLSLFVCSGIAHAQTMIYSQNFESAYSEWTLNSTATIAGTAGTNSAPTGNEWLVNNAFAAGTLGTATPNEPAGITGSPESNYLHMNCGTTWSTFYGSNDNYLANGSGDVYMAVMTTPQVTTGFTNVYFSFWWLCRGDATGDEGNVYYSTDGGSTWTQMTGVNFYSSTTWADDSLHLPAFDNQASLEFAFTFTDANASAHDPEFGIDDISLYGTTATVTAPTASFIESATTSCQDSCIGFLSTSTGTITGLAWSVDPTGPIVTSSVTGDTALICFPSAGAYSVTLTASNTGGSTTSTTVINISPTPNPIITNSGGTLSVTGAYTSYQWYIGSTPITGATNSSYTDTVSGTYSVQVDSNGCPGSSIAVDVTAGIANVSNTTTTYWISQSNNSSLNLNASISLSKPLTITIFDATGRKILNNTWNAGSITKQINDIYTPSGLYIIKLSNDYTSTILRWLKP